MNNIESKVNLSVVNIGEEVSYKKKPIKEESEKRMAPAIKSQNKVKIHLGVNMSAERLPGIRKKTLPLHGPGAEFDDDKFINSPKAGVETSLAINRYHATRSFQIKDHSSHLLLQHSSRKENSRNQISTDGPDQPVASS